MSDFIVNNNESSDTKSKLNQTNDDNNCYSKNECNLNENENKAVDEFLSRQNWPSSDAKNWNIAVKFLMARKFDVDRAIQLYVAHDSLRRKENLHLIDINEFEFLRDLETGKFTILPFLKNYPVCALFTVRLHSPQSTELTTLRTLIYQLDAALENPDAQRNGIIFIYDMNNCKSSNYDLALSKKLLTLIKGSYPARLNRLFVVSAPFWFKCLVKMLSVLMREKLRDRVSFVTNDELKTMVPIDILPNYLGGNVKLDHKNWLNECDRLITNKTSTCYYYYFKTNKIDSNGFCETITSASASNLSTTTTVSSTNTTSSSLQNNNRKRPSSDFIDILEKNQKIFLPNNSNGSVIENVKNSSYTCDNDEIDVYIDEDSIQQEMPDGMTIDELVNHVRSIGISGLQKEYTFLRTIMPSSTIDAFNDEKNSYKNRYKDVPCLDDTRIQLNNEINDEDGDDDDDYIHANYVDGYKQKNAYISTQGPLDETCEDFWKMIWQEKILVLVMTTKCMEQRRKKCSQYWPAIENETFKFGDFEIKNETIDKKNSYIISKLVLKHLRINEEKEIMHCQFTLWPDHGIPETANDMIEFVNVVRQYQASLTENSNWKGHPLGPPILVHCSAGIGRTGTFCTIDININRLLDTKKIDIKDTVIKIRSQRALSVQMPDQYVFCYMALIEYAIQENILNSDIKINELFN